MRKIRASVYGLLLFIFFVPGEYAASDQMREPFGLDKVAAPESSPTWQKWKKIIEDARAEIRRLERCHTEPEKCSAAQLRFSALVKQAKGKDGRAKIEFVNQLVNGAIRYQPDKSQWGIPDTWTLPIDPGSGGSLNTGAGDCEDFALAKYAVLHQAGVPDEHLRIVLVHDNAVREDHAILAVRHDQQWLILDNRWNILLKDEELGRFKALMAVERSGIYLLSKTFRIGDVLPSSNATSPDTEPLRHRLISPSVR